jgi:diacylglycerol kinase family enzyme
MHLNLILNRNAGALRDGDPGPIVKELEEIFRAHGHKVSTKLLPGKEAVAAIADACRQKSCDAVIVGGGDGTISTAAAEAAKHGLTLGILPLGTMNLFARSLGIPLQPAAAAEALATAEVASIDIGEANGRYFTHHVTLGLHPRMIRMRERLSYASRWGKIWASTQAWWMVVRHPPRLDVRMTVDGEEFRRRTAAILVSNNPLGEGHLPYADDPSQGSFGIYVARSRHWQDLTQLAAQIVLGDIAQNPLLEGRLGREVEIVPAGGTVTASVDGEIVALHSPLKFTLHHGGLRVLKPRSDGATLGPSRPAAPGNPYPAKPLTGEAEENALADELNEVEARQGDRRRMNMWVLFMGVPLAIVLMAIAYLIWS